MMSEEHRNHGRPLPPESRRFLAGTSGNSKGRPKGRKNSKTIVRAVAQRKVRLADGTKQPLQDLLVMKLRHAVQQGKVTEAKFFSRLVQKFDPPEKEEGVGFLVTPPPLPDYISAVDYAQWLAEQPVKKPPSILDDDQSC